MAKRAKKTGGPAAGGLKGLREKIDVVDRRILRALNERARLVERVGKSKRESGTPIYAPHREQQVLAKVGRLNAELGGRLSERTIEAIYRELMSGSFQIEQPLRIGYLGPLGSYSHLAATKQFGSSVEYEDLQTIEGVFTEVSREHVDYGLVPVENSIGGGIVETLDAFLKHHEGVRVYAEIQIAIHHALLANCKPREVTTIYSKPEIFQQCRQWLATQYPKAELVPAASSARAVQMVKESYRKYKAGEEGGEMGGAAIGSVLAGEAYGVHPLFVRIEDTTANVTRFLVISREETEPSGDDKTSIMFITEDHPGALVDVLSVFKRAGINLTHIEKRPSGRVNWTYSFFVDAAGHVSDPMMDAALKQVAGLAKEMHVLGSYPRSKKIL